MEKDEDLRHFKGLFYRKYENFKEWCSDKEHPHSKLNKNVFIYDFLKFAGFFLVLLILYNNVWVLNDINLIFIRIGSLLLLITLFFVIRKAIHLGINLRYWFRGFNHGVKLLISLIIILLLVFAFLNQGKVVNSIVEKYEGIDFSKFNPLSLNLNISSLNFNDCPQLDFLGNLSTFRSEPELQFQTSKRASFFSLKYEESFLSWSLKTYQLNSVKCEKGVKAGQNQNHYYCGRTELPATYMVYNVLDENANIEKVVQKTFINEYNEKGEFERTACGKTPEQITKDVEANKQAEEDKAKAELREFMNYFG